MTNPAAAIQVQWLFNDEATRFLRDKGLSDEIKAQIVQFPPGIGDWVSWARVADNQPFEVISRWFIWTADGTPRLQIDLSLPQRA